MSPYVCNSQSFMSTQRYDSLSKSHTKPNWVFSPFSRRPSFRALNTTFHRVRLFYKHCPSIVLYVRLRVVSSTRWANAPTPTTRGPKTHPEAEIEAFTAIVPHSEVLVGSVLQRIRFMAFLFQTVIVHHYHVQALRLVFVCRCCP